MEEALKKFKEDFIEVEKRGFIESHRTHNTGIGKTFEDLVGVEENNKPEMDYMDKIELKSTRELSSSMLTIFTKAPSHPKGANTLLREKFGKEDKGMKILHTTISGNKFNTFLGKYGFKLEVDEKEKKIFIKIKDLKSDVLLDFETYYDFKNLQKIVEKKCSAIAFISAKHKKVEGKEFFHFEKAVLLSGLTFNKFLDAIKKGIILYDIRIGVYRSGDLKGKTHDHGSGFRIKKEKIKDIFKVEKI